jgi:hypothetical protein
VLKRLLVTFAFITFFLGLPTPANAWFGPKAGDSCQILEEKKSISGRPYICERDLKGLSRWLINTPTSDANSALSLVTLACTDRLGKTVYVYMAPIQMEGAIWQRAAEDGLLSYPSNASGKARVQSEIRVTATITNRFETAATLDSKWARINSLWIDGISAVYTRWKKGISFVDAANSSISNLDTIESICKVALAKSVQKSALEHRSLDSWLTRNAKEYF